LSGKEEQAEPCELPATKAAKRYHALTRASTGTGGFEHPPETA
jgi:hypothetical protein